MKQYSVFIGLLLLLATGCKKEPAGMSYLQTYSLSVDKTAKKINAMAVFRTDSWGNPRKLADGASIKLNGKEPVYSNDGVSYHWNISEIPDHYTFELTKSDGSVITNIISAEDVGDIAFDIVPDTVYKSKPYEFFWKGPVLRANERLAFSLFDSGSQMIRYETRNTGALLFSTQDLKDRVEGEAELSVGRSRSIDLKQKDGEAGGAISVGIDVERKIIIAR